YKEWFAINAAGQTVRPGSDCAIRVSLNAYSGTTAFVDSPVHNGTASHCAGQIAKDQALSAKTTSGNTFSGGSLDLHNGTTLGPNVGLPGTQALNGWFYLDPASFPASRGAALGGIIYYANTGRNYIAFGVDANNHPVLLKQFSNGTGAAPVTLGTNLTRTVSVGAWQHFELRASQQGGIWSLWLNGSEALKVSGVNDAALWGQGVLLRSFFGISDHLQNPNALTVYYDDISIGTNSFEDCFGWNSTICPFTPGAQDSTPPSIPANPRAVAASSSQIDLSWTASTDNVGVTGYRIFRSGTQIGTSAGTSLSITGLSASTGYSYTVAAYDAAGNTSGQSAAASATTLAAPAGDVTAPTVPAGLSAGAVSSSQINLTWTASTDNVGVSGYRIFRSGTQIGTAVGTSFSSTGLSSSTAYSYTVAAYDAAGNTSGHSATASATTQSEGAAATCPTLANPSIYSASADFSGLQGCRQWSYRDSTGANMAF
ncbi:MAG: fibronectin type III domain-containing protein, partial [Chloroflexota bacterium]